MNLNGHFTRESLSVRKSLATCEINDLLSSSQSAVDFRDDKSFKVYDLDCSRVLVVLQNSFKFYFLGSVKVQCIYGLIDVFGFLLKPNQAPVNVYSLPGNSAMYCSSVDTTSDPNFEVSHIMKLGFGLMEATKVFNNVRCERSSLLIMEKIPLPFKLTNQLPIRAKNCSKPERILDAQFDSDNKKLRKIILNTTIEIIPVKPSFRFVLCAGQGLGKSTVLRYLINKALNDHKKVLYIDTDIGQSEFTLPESISAVIVDEPLLGPPYTHFKKPLLSYHLGTNNASDCVERFLKAVKMVVNECSNNEEVANIPWFVNTMGFCKGIGVVLNANIIYYIKPTHVIQIQGPYIKNYPTLLKPNYVSSTVSDTLPQYSLLVINAFESNKKQEGHYSNPEMRWLGMQSYFNNVLNPSYYLVLPSAAVKVINCKMKKEVDPAYYHMLSSKVVTLCTWGDSEDFPKVFDYGILIGFDKESSNFIVLTPAQENDEIKAIYLGTLQIPSKVDKFLDCNIKGFLPYVQLGSSSATLANPTRKSFRFLFEK